MTRAEGWEPCPEWRPLLIRGIAEGAMTSHKPQDPDLPTKEEIRLLSKLPDDVQARLSLAGTEAESEFHADAVYYHLPDHEDDYAPGEVEDKKQKLMGMCDRLASRVVRSYFEELAVLPIAPGTLRRLLYYILATVSTRLFRDKWRAYVPADPSETQADFLDAAIEHHRPAIEQYYGDALRMHEKRLAESLKSGAKKAKADAKKKTTRRGRRPDDDVSARNAFIAAQVKQGRRGLEIAKRLDHAGKYDDDPWLEKKRTESEHPKLTWTQALGRYPTEFRKLIDRATTP